MALYVQGHAAGSVLGCELSFGALGCSRSCRKRRLSGTSIALLSSCCSQGMRVTHLSFGEVMCFSPSCPLRTVYFLVKGCGHCQLQNTCQLYLGLSPPAPPALWWVLACRRLG